MADIHRTVAPGFEAVREAFENNVDSHLPPTLAANVALSATFAGSSG